jgi:hypothetical protein
MSHFENYMENTKKRYGIQRLETDTEMRYGEPANPQASRWHTERMEYLRNKYLPKGSLEFIGYAAPEEKGKTVSELERLRGIEESRGEALYSVANDEGQRFFVGVKLN